MTKNRIVHLGVGHFHRAHQAVYTQEAGDDWDIIGVSLRRPAVRDCLRAQDFRYHVLEKSADGSTLVPMTVLKDILVAPESPDAVLAVLADPACKVVTLTITEKGYYFDPASGQLQLTHPDIVRDGHHVTAPKTAVGFLVGALQQRYEKGIPPFTVVSCDNLPANGKLLKNSCVQFANSIDRMLADWIAQHVCFPSTMVDRIVPAMTDDDVAEVLRLTGCQDNAVVPCEPFKQWIIEDNFCNERPSWEKSGAFIVPDVTPFEIMKLRLLNASHSALAYVGFLAGYETIYEAMQDDTLIAYLNQMMTDEIMPHLVVPEQAGLSVYRDSILERFNNPQIKHKLYQIAMDGSQKIPQRILPSIKACIEAGEDFNGLLRALAAWIQYTGRRDIIVQDPLAEQMTMIHQQAGDDVNALVTGYLALPGVFSNYFQENTVFKSALYDIL
ncbi:MAG: mannitol dehydrogenase [Coxiella sp. (in: Bacteria)]|nr:MAG: mannitol dehydrogenase [Coxiella sp. (in: g-proteobacteria)]